LHRREVTVNMNVPERLISVNTAAERLELSPGTVRNWLAQGRLTRFKVGVSTRLDPTEIDRLIHRRPLDRRIPRPTVDPR
jgi:excisionase family DNA binding protein